MPQEKQQQQSAQGGKQAAGGLQQGIPLSQSQQAAAGKIEGQIKMIEQQLTGASNSELKEISTKLESVERAMLLEKIDNQLHTMKETIVKPGDGVSTAADGTAAARASVINQPTSS